MVNGLLDNLLFKFIFIMLLLRLILLVIVLTIFQVVLFIYSEVFYTIIKVKLVYYIITSDNI
jgi:hypothetical protein